MKSYIYDRQENETAIYLANLFGITKDELECIEYDLRENYSNDGMLLYGYIVDFSPDNDQCIMEKIKNLHPDLNIELQPWELEPHEDTELEWELENRSQLEIFNAQLDQVLTLLEIYTTDDTEFSLLVMLHAHIISALEYFLSTTFITKVTNANSLIRKVVETDPEFKKRKFTLDEIYNEQEKLQRTVASHLKTIIFHKIDRVKQMYKSVFSYDFGNDIRWLYKLDTTVYIEGDITKKETAYICQKMKLNN